MTDFLREKNPGLRLFSVLDKEFSAYGRVLDIPHPEELSAVLAGQPIPESGNHYEPSIAELEAAACMGLIKETAFGLMDIQAGYCNGHGYTLNAFEYHRCSEVNFSTTGLVLLLALPGQLIDGCIDSSEAAVFYLPAGVAVEIYPMVMHFAPCRVSEGGFNCLVVLEKGTNSPIDLSSCTDRLLWMKNKWMTCHGDSPQAQKGAFQGISGENIQLKI